MVMRLSARFRKGSPASPVARTLGGAQGVVTGRRVGHTRACGPPDAPSQPGVPLLAVRRTCRPHPLAFIPLIPFIPGKKQALDLPVTYGPGRYCPPPYRTADLFRGLSASSALNWVPYLYQGLESAGLGLRESRPAAAGASFHPNDEGLGNEDLNGLHRTRNPDRAPGFVFRSDGRCGPLLRRTVNSKGHRCPRSR